MPRGKLDVYVERAVQIKDTTISGKGSPHCTLTVGSQVFSSPPVEEGGTHPIFDTKFEFQIDRTTEQLMVQIYSRRTSTNDDLLGYCTIFFKDAFHHSFVVPVTPYTLTDPSGGLGGYIRLSLIFTPSRRAPQPIPAAADRYRQSRPPSLQLPPQNYAAGSSEAASYPPQSSAVASSSGRGGMEEDVVPIKKVQAKCLKSGRLIGKGPSSVVYETTWKRERYARKDFLRVPSDVFEEEAAALVGLDHHPNVVRTYCWTVDEGSCSLVVELMDDDLLNMMETRKDSQRKKSHGSASQTSHLIDLHKFLEDGKNASLIPSASESVAMPLVYPFDMPEALQIMLQIAEGMKFLHDEGVVHGDLKPKNILVTPGRRVLDQNMSFQFKLADFGLVGTKMTSRSLVSRQARKLEMIRWRAPELLDLSCLREDEHKCSTDSDWDSDSSDGIISGHVQNFTFMDMVRADVYNFGLTCSQILHGGDPCSGLGVDDLVKAKTLLGVRAELPPTCPAQLSDLIKLCWGETTERPSFQDILSELKDLQASFTRTGSPMNIITGPPFGRIESELEDLVFKNSAVSRESRERPGGSSNLVEGLEIDQKVGVPTGHLIKDIQDSSEGTLELKQRRRGRKALRYLGILVCIPPKARSSLSSVSKLGNINDEQKENEDISTSKKRSSSLKRSAKSGAWENNKGIKRLELNVPQRFSFNDIKRLTNNFNNDNKLGEGRYGKVYKGIQAGTGAMVAVKRAQEDSEQGAQEFKNEIELLSRVHHNNLVGLVGFCIEKGEHMLVYEYMPNGTLTDWLRGPMSDPPLDWDRRLLIALGAARGLAYLHDHADPPIIHLNVTSRSILLDKNLNAKVAGFGLSMLVPDEEDGILVKGTVGYLDPEYFITGVPMTKSDVYSFGVVLVELLTGRPPVSHGGHVVRDVRKRFELAGLAGVDELLDPAVASLRDDELETLLNIAVACVEESSLERPSMHVVVKQLEALVEPKAQLMPGHGHAGDTRMATTNRDWRVPLEISEFVFDDFEPDWEQFSQESSIDI